MTKPLSELARDRFPMRTPLHMRFPEGPPPSMQPSPTPAGILSILKSTGPEGPLEKKIKRSFLRSSIISGAIFLIVAFVFGLGLTAAGIIAATVKAFLLLT